MSHTRYVSTIDINDDDDDDDTVAIRSQQVNVNLELGQIRDVGHTTYIRSTYAGRYNFAVKQYNHYDTENVNKKRYMRGGRLFLYGIIVLILFIVSILLINQAKSNKALIAIPIIISIIYLFITSYNWHIHRTNASLIHDNMIKVQDKYLSGSINEHFKIPVHARIQNRELIAATDGTTIAVLARLQQRYQNLTEIDIMLYKNIYLTKYACFPSETILHFLLFLGILIASFTILTGKQ
ncbi:unnamed protein product [Adineta steineri]|uniref:Uncharacterized protein n=1 Tax=Adineta steineri TaxID=433720 RepID=A0A815UMM6_9BILA|nr:unnamed protein product [Adineta steineri]CAF1519677.1 unnamed protein product [Adineta steineri]